MKKAVSLILAIVMCFSLAGCGKTNVVSKETEATLAGNAAQNNTLIEFNNVVLVNNETVKIELINFYAEDVNWVTGTQNEKYITVKATNKTDHDIILNPGKFYLGEDEVYVLLTNGSIAPAPGKSGNYAFIIANNTSPEHTALNSLEALYTLEGSFTGLHKYEDSSKNKMLNVDFDVQAAINGEVICDTEDATTQPEEIYEIGDTVSTDTVEFTLTGFNYVYHLNPSSYAEKDDISGGSLGPGTDMVFANPEYTITNTSKNAIDAHNVVEFSIDYNDGFIFNMYDHISYLVDSPSFTRKLIGKGTSQGVAMTLSPLSSETYEMYFVANARIETDTDSSLLLKVILDSSNGTEEFVFRIR